MIYVETKLNIFQTKQSKFDNSDKIPNHVTSTCPGKRNYQQSKKINYNCNRKTNLQSKL